MIIAAKGFYEAFWLCSISRYSLGWSVFMGKLKDIVAEEASLRHRIENNAKRVKLAGLGLIYKVDSEREKWYRQVLDAADADLGQGGIINRINVLSKGTLNLVREESQRIFDELVEAGELAAASRNHTNRPAAGGQGQPAAAVNDDFVASAADKKPKVAAVTQIKPKVTTRAQMQADSVVSDVGQVNEAFDLAQQRIKTLKSAPNQGSLQRLYALYKQATEGDVKGRRPALTKVIERAKYDARHALKGMDSGQAKQAYVNLVNELMGGS
jgi:acyl-CoA-binding protein